MVLTHFKKFDLLHELNGRYIWDVKCANCQKLISTSSAHLLLHGNRIFENVAAKILHLFCNSSCKTEWLKSTQNKKKKKNTIKKKPKVSGNGIEFNFFKVDDPKVIEKIDIKQIREIMNAQVQFFFDKNQNNGLNLCLIDELNISQLGYLKAVVEEQLKNE